MFSFFKKKKVINSDESKIDINSLQKFYTSKVKNYIWDDYQKLNKFEKIYAFSAEYINDINIINELRKAYFNSKEPNNKASISKDIKKQIKDQGLLLKDIPSLITINSTILYQLIRYLNKDSLILSEYIRIFSPLLKTSPKLEVELHNVIFHKNEKDLYKYIPPNHPKDHSQIMFLREKQLDKYKPSKIEAQELHPDYDFNILEFIINDYKK